ncbi:hypothetical protein TWF694_011817 [Orbilia ellipsospora]|uniref:Macro domain-containing protein n=1 Tax=Orbilia ellipsospora TaxID=2528407 RepID=A0AAV9X6R2_9PEZI
MSSFNRQPIPLDRIPSLTTLYEQGKLDASIAASARAPPNKKINDAVLLIQADMTKLQVDAIVNAANKSLLGGGGIDGAIHRAAGEELYYECLDLNGCETGQAKITKGHRLPAKHIIHTVGPIYWDQKEAGRDPAKLLKDCYVNSLDVARRNGCKSIAFCCVSTGIYGYPNSKAAELACETIRTYLEKQADEEGEAKSKELFGEDSASDESSGGVKLKEEGLQGEKGEEKGEEKPEGEKGEVTEPAVVQSEQAEIPEKAEETEETTTTSKEDAEKETPPAQEPEFNCMVEKVIFCLFMEKDVSAYQKYLPAWFPPSEDVEGGLDKSKPTEGSSENARLAEEETPKKDDNGVGEAMERLRQKTAEN